MRRRLQLLTLLLGLLLLLSACTGGEEIKLSQVQTDLQKTYGEHLLSLENKEGILEIHLSLQDEEAPRIKKEIQDRYPDHIAFVLENVAGYYTICTVEDAEKHALDVLIQNGLHEDCKLISMGDIEPYRQMIQMAEIEKKVEEEIERRLEDCPTVIPLDKDVVEKGDLVKVSYRIFDMNREYGFTPSESVRVGGGYFDLRIEDTLPGRRTGESYVIDYSKPSIWGGGPGMQCEVTPLFCYTLEPAVLNDDFVKENAPYCQSVQEWRDWLRNSMSMAEKDRLWSDIIDNMRNESRFELDEELLAQRAAEMYMSSKFLAEQFGVEMDGITGVLYQGNPEIYLKACYCENQKELEEYLLVGGIAQYAGIRVEEEEIQAYCEENGLHWEQMEESMQKESLYFILRRKVQSYMIGLP